MVIASLGGAALIMEAGPRVGALTTHRDQLPSSSQYELLLRIASGGMATVYVGRRTGAAGFSREVAIKRAHAHLLEDPSFAKMLVAEAKIAARIHHPNVVAVQAVELLEGELLLVMDYVEGAALSELAPLSSGAPRLPAGVVARILLDAAQGLEAAHTATGERGEPLGLVHRDVSPQNILIGIDGIARVSDFGIAKTTEGTDSQVGKTATGTLKGKVAYMPPEYVEGGRFDVRSDVFALGVVAWEAFTGTRLFRGANEVETLRHVLAGKVVAPSTVAPSLGTTFDEIVLRSLARSPSARWPSARAFGDAIEAAARAAGMLATVGEVATAVRRVAGPALAHRRALIHKSAAQSESSVRVVGRADATGTLDIDVPVIVGEPSETAVRAPLFTGEVGEAYAEAPPGDAPGVPTFATGVSSRSIPTSEAAAKEPRGKTARRAALATAFLLLVGAGLGVAWKKEARTVVAPAVAIPAAPTPSTLAAGAAPPPSPSTSVEAPSAEARSTEAPMESAVSASASALPQGTPPVRSAAPRARPRTAPTRPPDRAPPNPYGDGR